MQNYTTHQMLEKLVSFDTTSHKSNLELVDFVDDYLKSHGAQTHRTYNKEKTKANLLAVIGPLEEGGVVLSGHTDVVPTEGQDWTSSPYTLRSEGDRFIGRGTTDMKGYVAACLAAVPMFKKAPLKRPIFIALSYDEEVGCLGVPLLVEQLQTKFPKPAAVIVGEPTNMEIAIAHKGINCYRTTFKGVEGHSSDPGNGMNAIAIAAEFVHYLNFLAEELRQDAAKHDDRFTPPHTTLNVGRISGGSAINMIAGECRVEWEFRLLPGTKPRDILEQIEAYVATRIMSKIQARFPEVKIATSLISSVKPFDEPEDSAAVNLGRTLLPNAGEVLAMPYATEAGAFQNAGIPTIVCGPGNLAQAHQPDEFIEKSELDACDKMLKDLAEHLSHGQATLKVAAL